MSPADESPETTESPESRPPASIDDEQPQPAGREEEDEDEEAPPWREEVTKWVSTAVGLISAMVGTSTLLHEKFVLPFTEPISIRLELGFDSFRPAESGGDGSMVILRAKAKNESDRRKWLLKPHWILYGHTSQLEQKAEEEDAGSNGGGAPRGFVIPTRFFKEINTALEFTQSSTSSVELPLNAYASLSGEGRRTEKRFLGMGQLFPVDEMHRGQEINVQKVIRVPRVPELQYIEAIVNIPTLNDSHILDSKEEIRWGGCLVSPNWPWECLEKDGDAPPVKPDRGDYRVVNWRNFFCEDLPLSRNYSLSLHQLINTFSTRRFYKPQPAPQGNAAAASEASPRVEEDRFCGSKTLGFHTDERTAVGAKTQTFTHSFLVRGEQP
jgi:hypothetical protein